MLEQTKNKQHEADAAANAAIEPTAKKADNERPLGSFLLTHYTFALEADHIHAHSPKVEAKGLPPEHKYKQSFLGLPYGVEMQGTGLGEDGRYIHWQGGGRYAEGVGGARGAPRAWQTVAVDPRVIPLGSKLIIDAYRDKGVFEATDTGGAINGQHLDVFAGAIPISEAYALGTKHSAVSLVTGGGAEHAAPQQHGGAQHGVSLPHTKAAPSLEQVRAGHGMITLGMHGAGVAKVQSILHVPVDSDFGPITEAAVKAFQRRHGLEVDGQVGVKTATALEGGAAHAPAAGAHPGHAHPGGGATHHDLATPSLAEVRTGHAALKKGMAGGSVREAQALLHTHVDGEFSKVMEEAVMAFQRRHGLQVDGEIGVHTLAALEKAPAHHGGAPQKDPHPQHEPPVASGGDPVSIARQYVTHPPTETYRLKGRLPHFQAAGGTDNDCADFVSSVLMTAGRISGHHVNVGEFHGSLKAAGWRAVPAAESVAGDVWMDASASHHTVLVSGNGGSRLIGSNNDGAKSDVQIVDEHSGPWSGQYMHKKF